MSTDSGSIGLQWIYQQTSMTQLPIFFSGQAGASANHVPCPRQPKTAPPGSKTLWQRHPILRLRDRCATALKREYGSDAHIPYVHEAIATSMGEVHEIAAGVRVATISYPLLLVVCGASA